MIETPARVLDHGNPSHEWQVEGIACLDSATCMPHP